MPNPDVPPPPQNGHKPWLFTPETARAASLKARQLREARTDPIRHYKPELPAVTDEAARELLPRILSDEITFRSELLATIREMQAVIVHSVRESFYDQSRQTLPQLVTALTRTTELSLRIVDSTKGLDLTGSSASQVSGLFAKAVLLRRELVRMGIMDRDGNYKAPAGAEPGESEPEAADPVDAPPAVADAPSAGEEGVL